jgi:regulator of protease activity HflC (stomatin/prohibitin superfamily)
MAVVWTVVIVLVVLFLFTLAVKVVKQYEQGVLFRLGRVTGTRQDGLAVIVPFVDVLNRVSLRIVTMPIQSQGIITRDNVSKDVATEDWGVEVTLVELKDIQLPDSMKRAMARQAGAERERWARSSQPRVKRSPPTPWARPRTS